jgi:hypothetical protein
MERRTVEGREVLLEFRQVGEFVKVTAIDPDSLVEVSLVASPRAGEAELIRLALRKLEYVERHSTSASRQPGAPRGGRGGIDA